MLTNFYPRSPCGERRVFADGFHSGDTISIHALLAESDSFSSSYGSVPASFLSTLSLRRATSISSVHALPIVFLSTLSLRRATINAFTLVSSPIYFYPRSPCGERPMLIVWLICSTPISIHALLAESDSFTVSAFLLAPISIHALLAESDVARLYMYRSNKKFLSTLSLRRATRRGHVWAPRHCHFYPRSPCGERRKPEQYGLKWTCISIHALLAESDRNSPVVVPRTGHFYPRSPCGERRVINVPETPNYGFLSTLSLRRATHPQRGD